MRSELYHLTVDQLDPAAPDLGTRGKVVSGPCLHYSAPSAGGWGIVRTALLVPESVMLFVAPHGCGRHGSVSACSWACAGASATWTSPRRIWCWAAT